MLSKIQELIGQIETFLSDKKGFETQVKQSGAIINVVMPNGTSIQYDGYELLLYTLATRKLGSDIKLNINQDQNGDDIFAINSGASYNIAEFVLKTNISTEILDNDVHSVVLCTQVANSDFPYSVCTFAKKGTWLRYDLTLSELLYAAVNGLKLEQQQDGAYAYTKLREYSKKLQDELQDAADK
jgi:hypothetical protein